MYQVLFGKNTTQGKKKEVLGRKTGRFYLSIENHIKPQKERARPPLRCIAYRKESECVLRAPAKRSNIVVQHLLVQQC